MPMVLVADGCTSLELMPVRSCAGVNWGSLFKVASTAMFAVFLNCSELTVTIGLLEVKSRFAMREPVTTTSFTAVWSADLSCA